MMIFMRFLVSNLQSNHIICFTNCLVVDGDNIALLAIFSVVFGNLSNLSFLEFLKISKKLLLWHLNALV